MQILIGFNVSSRAISSFHFRLSFSGFTIDEVVTFGAPKFMDTMSTALLQIVAQLRRVTLEGDPIPAFPPLRSYSHAGLEVLALPLLSVLIICWQLRSSPFLLLLWVLVSYGSSIRECVGVSRFFGMGPTNPPPLFPCAWVSTHSEKVTLWWRIRPNYDSVFSQNLSIFPPKISLNVI